MEKRIVILDKGIDKKEMLATSCCPGASEASAR